MFEAAYRHDYRARAGIKIKRTNEFGSDLRHFVLGQTTFFK